MRVLKAAILVALTACFFVPFAAHDLAQLGKKSEWSSFDKIRVKSYLEVAGLIGWAAPPVGPLKGIHHWSRLGDAYIDSHLPPESTMSFLRQAVLESPGDRGKGNSFKNNFYSHEQTAMHRYNTSGQTVYTSDIVQKVSFWKYGVPIHDYWAIRLRTDIVNGSPKSSFIVWGLGIVTDHRNAKLFGPQLDPIAGAIGLKGEDLISWTTKVESEGIAKPYWILITDTPETSAFSYGAMRKAPSVRKKEWALATHTIHKSGQGSSAQNLFDTKY